MALADAGFVGFSQAMVREPTDFSLSLEQLTGLAVGDPDDAPTPMVAAIFQSWKKPLDQLSVEEIGRLVVQSDGYPYLLDLVWPKLEGNPLFDARYYPGDVLSSLIRADPDIWAERPEYQARLPGLYTRALAAPPDQNEAFRDSLQLPDMDRFIN